jgi:methylmalonyl-CoA mutase N-terminal domain/subunit
MAKGSSHEHWKHRFDEASKRSDVDFVSQSSAEVEPLYTPADTDGALYEEQLGDPGAYPFTRGIHPTMYRGRLWTMRQFSGFGTAEDTNRRYKFLLERGQTGLSVAFDFPTLMGYDSDHPRSEGEVGKCGVAIASLADMETLFDGIPLEQVSTSMTINGPAAILFCFYVAAAERQGADITKLRGTVQNDILKEYMAQHAWVFPVEPALKIIVDLFEWASEHTPLWNTISISGYHIREAGSTAVQELAFTLANGFEYVERGMARGLDVDRFARRLSFFWARRAPNLGAPPAGTLRRQGSAVVDDAVPLPNRGRLAHCAAADEQRGAGCLSGDGCRAGGSPVAPHQLARRDAGTPDRRCGQTGIADAAGVGVRNGGGQRHRSARRLVLHGGPDGSHGA